MRGLVIGKKSSAGPSLLYAKPQVEMWAPLYLWKKPKRLLHYVIFKLPCRTVRWRIPMGLSYLSAVPPVGSFLCCGVGVL